MLGLPLTFAAPAALAALVLLAALYIFLRVTPPRPREILFPPLRLLLGLDPRDQTPHRTPWPLLLLRIAICAAIILAMAGPIWNAIALPGGGAGPLLLLMDDGWAAAPAWERRIAVARERLAAAGGAGRLAALVPVSQGGVDIAPADSAHNIEKLRALAPTPYAPDRAEVVGPVQRFLQQNPQAEIVWIADGQELGGAGAFAQKLAGLSSNVTVLTDKTSALGLTGVDNLAGALQARVLRADPGARQKGVLRALDAKGLTIGETPFDFGGTRVATAKFDLPIELRNDVARVAIVDERSAGAVALLDERWKRRRVAIASGASADIAQPLLAPTYYLSRALAPFADVREWRDNASDPVVSLIAEKPAVLALADMSVGSGAAHDALAKFVDDGGVLIRFAGARLAATADDLTPTALRRGGRTLGGALSWETPKRLAPFDRDSPFFGLATPDEVTISRQVLSEPEPGLAAKTWARLADGTPLVTADRRGKGLIVLFHVTADTTWSNLPLSGLFVDMLRKIVALAGAPPPDKDGAPSLAAASQATYAPARALDGFGALGAPPVTAKPIAADFSGIADASHPPGFYGSGDALIAVNALAPAQELSAADYGPLPVQAGALNVAAPLDLRPWLLGAAFIGLLADALASLWLGGAFGLRRASTIAAALAVLSLCAVPLGHRAMAAEQAPISERDKDAALSIHLAYIVTGDSSVDETSRSALANLSRVLAQRTSLSPGEPFGLDPAHDELSFYPLIYWPVVAGRPQPETAAITRIAAYMKSGGTFLFDTRDALAARPGGPQTPEGLWLQKLLAGVDVPELEPVPRDHVVTKSFYLIDGFVGRTTIGQTWIEALPPPDPGDTSVHPARAGDSVSPIVITSNDLAGAWAADNEDQPLFPLIPGGARQRELSLRGGVNLVMYTLTGNYKADQVHARDLIERLSH
ncbi:DUF4159 domain-containing protein [Methylocapsa sp. S129]|uniref:DUF4159 domain-containing protein n=1 Tax=Methylocapsa sp. S129 TaxID=1641869 RepID=UPI00131DC484|nr:DUF4159 domain-containing protein [Methylocapsa sp. S129]